MCVSPLFDPWAPLFLFLQAGACDLLVHGGLRQVQPRPGRGVGVDGRCPSQRLGIAQLQRPAPTHGASASFHVPNDAQRVGFCLDPDPAWRLYSQDR